MPELPEVENVKISLEEMGVVGQRFRQVTLKRSGLRTKFGKDLKTKLTGEKILGITRRAKYLLIETRHFIVLSHLGMTGSWRDRAQGELGKHDHVIFHFESGLELIFNDPRRFGILELVVKEKLPTNKWLKHLGLEPLTEEFNAEYLFKKSRKVAMPIKSFLMDQKRLVGVGNIYASEALFLAGVRPTRSAGKITQVEATRIVESIKAILRESIQAGGSTISDYRNSKGEIGQFQQRFRVYDRVKEKCTVCSGKISSRILSGRNTFWCAKCQR